MIVGSALERISRPNVLCPNVCVQMSRAQMSGFVRFGNPRMVLLLFLKSVLIMQ